MAATCGSMCWWRFSPHTSTRTWSDMWFPSKVLLDRPTGGAGGDVLLGDDQQDDRRDGGEHRGGHHRAPVGDVRAEIRIDAQRDRRDVALGGQGEREQEVAPGEQER